MSPFVDRLIREGGASQQIWFSAACVERSVGILFWVASRDGRDADVDVYREVLDMLWEGAVNATWGDYIVRIEGMDDLESGYERGGIAPYGFYSAALIHSCLKFGLSRYPAGLAGIAEEAINGASQIGFSVNSDVASQEVGEQLLDANGVLASDAMPAVTGLLRERARRFGRDRLLLIKAWADENGI